MIAPAVGDIVRLVHYYPGDVQVPTDAINNVDMSTNPRNDNIRMEYIQTTNMDAVAIP
jgi:hypothetical protein